MALIEFCEDGREFELSYKMLRNLAKNFPDDEKYSELAENIVSLNIPSLTEEVLSHAVLSNKVADEIWKNGDAGVRANLLKRSYFVQALSSQQTNDIIQQNDNYMNECLAANCDKLFDGPDREKKSRMTAAEREKLLCFISSLTNWPVRFALAHNSRIPPEYRPTLTEQIKFKVPQDQLCFKNMTMADFPVLKNTEIRIMQRLAENLESVRDKAVRNELINFFLSSSDPGLRLCLAEAGRIRREHAPFLLRALEILANDPEIDVAEAARKNLLPYEERRKTFLGD